jgi:hypothetical protein
MAVPWIWVAAATGYGLAGHARRAVILGALVLVVANLSYFVVGRVVQAAGVGALASGVRFLMVWTGLGLVVGPIAGWLGWRLRDARTAMPSVVLMSTVSIAEPLALWAHIDHVEAHLAYVVVALSGLAFAAVWFRTSPRDAGRALGLALVLAYPAAVVLEAALVALGQISAPLRLI